MTEQVTPQIDTRPDYYKGYFLAPIIKQQLDKIRKLVMEKDRDFVFIIDGDEGAGKSVLAQQMAAYLDPNFTIDKICFNSNPFIEKLKNCEKNSCIVLDEAFSAANSRASLTDVNRSLIGVATEMRQKNLFVIILLPSFFDLDRYFALHRCRALFHVYFDNKDGGRGQYVIFSKNQMKALYILGKKFYSYSKPHSTFPPMRFNNYYPVDEIEYRKRKSLAFQKRTVSKTTHRFIEQRSVLLRELWKKFNYSKEDINKMFREKGLKEIPNNTLNCILTGNTEAYGNEREAIEDKINQLELEEELDKVSDS